MSKTMNYDKTKSIEASVLEAIAKHDCDPKELTKFAEQCFAANRVRNFNESQLKRQENWLTQKDSEIRRHKDCINSLRGYIDYLEKELANLKTEINYE